MADLNKMFVLVPKGKGTTVASIKEVSKGTNKIYFLEEFNQIIAKGTVYGVDPVSSNNLTTLVNSLGADVAEDGTVSFDWTGFNYADAEASPADTLLKVLKTIDATLADIVTRVTKLENGIDNSKTLKWDSNNIEFSGSIRYVAAAEGVAAHIALVDEAGAELSTVPVSDIVGNGVLKSSAYDAATGILTLTFAQADGTTKAVEVDLKAMLDINDMSIDADSTDYLKVTLGTAEGEGNTQAVFGAKIVKVAEATDSKTGLVDAKDIKDYVDTKATDLAVKAQGDDYITAAVDAGDNKQINVTADVQALTATAGTVGVYNAEGAQTTAPVAGTLEGVDKSLVDGADVATKVKTYVDGAVAIEAARADAKVLAAVKGLDKASATVDGTNVHVTYKEEDGIVTVESVAEDYATVNRVATTSTSVAPATDASITVTVGDEAKLVKASDLKAVADYAADKVTEEAHRVNKHIEDTIDALDVAETTISEPGEGAINFKYSENNGKVAINDLSATYAEHSTGAITTGIVTGTVLNNVLGDMWETYNA